MPGMPALYADLHVHSRYSRACSRDLDLEHLAWWARRKGITVVGTGDFTHPRWLEELRGKLVPAEPGLWRLREDLDAEVLRTLPAACQKPVRFMLSVEVSTIYKRGERTRKVHHLIYAPDFEAVERVNHRLSRIGNLTADGRPILGLDSRDLLEITLESGEGSYLVPAHVWTPWFAALGSKSGFDAIEECYGELADHIFAIETGLSSDPAMNWRVSSLDRYRLVSNSDAHSPPMLGREACVFNTELDYFAMRRALETGQGYRGTIEFFPEEGKYHLDGHRKCGVRLEPGETRRLEGRCPTCGRPLTVGVLHRVEELADRPEGARPEGAAGFRSLVPLPEIMGEILGVGPKSKAVEREVAALTGKLGPELPLLDEVPLDEIRRVGPPLLAEAVGRLRRGEVIREAGYDGEYGVIRLFRPEELEPTAALFQVAPAAGAGPGRRRRAAAPPDPAGTGAAARPAAPAAGAAGPSPVELDRSEVLGGLDAEQRLAVLATDGPVLVVAGPGTGKTRVLTHRIAYLVAERGVAPERCLAITFTRRARDELAARLAALVPGAERVLVSTFHGLGLLLLRELHGRVGLSAGFRVADAGERLALASEAAGGGERAGQRLLEARARDLRGAAAGGDLAAALDRYEKGLRARDLVDLEDLVALPVRLLEGDPELARRYQERWGWVSVDEYQDVDELQYRLLRALVPPGGNLCAIGDPDQAIYSFRGADVGFFLRFRQDHPGARVVRLTRNYRSSPAIVRGALQAVAPASLVPDRVLTPAAGSGLPRRIVVHEAASEQDEATFVARTIEGLLGGASFFSLDSGWAEAHGTGGLSFADVAVLYRTDAQAGPLLEALGRAGMPVQKRSHDRLADRPDVQAVVRALRAGAGGGGELPVTERVRRAAAAAGEAAGGALELLGALAERCGHDLERFLAELALGEEVDTWDPRADRVSLLTLHAAKGLEFPVVFLVGCSDGLLPLRLGSGSDLAEERRLFFVGMTRARSHLFLSYARRRARHGRVEEAAPSPFLADIEDRLLDRRRSPTRRAPAPKADQLRLI